MTVQEWKTLDKTPWPRGAWDHEPDKIQWVDTATDLDCLMVRNHGGAWCGYVGVGPKHPMFEQHYEKADVDVHGGLTFADFCDEPTRERYDEIMARMESGRMEAARFPVGDSARFLRQMEPFVGDFEGWVQHHMARHICHLPAPGRPAKVWWLGFDCAHSGDKSDMAWSYIRDADPDWPKNTWRDGDEYRDRAYVEKEVTELARQLGAMKKKAIHRG